MSDLITQLCQIIAEILQNNPQADSPELIALVEAEIKTNSQLIEAIKNDSRLTQINQDDTKAFQTLVTGGIANIGIFLNDVNQEQLQEVLQKVINSFNVESDIRKLEEDYLDSPEWEKIEESTIDRGTELLNLLLYLQECKDEAIEPELGDFLREFLLVDEDEFQDEHRIYEEVIANQILVESDLKEVARVTSELSDDSELKELFYSMIGFFRDTNPSDSDFNDFVNHSPNPDFDSAVYSLLISYNS